MELYEKRIKEGILKKDEHQLKTINELNKLRTKLINIKEPPILDELAGLDIDILTNSEYTQKDLISPDFDWHNNKDNETIFGKLWTNLVSFTKKETNDLVKETKNRLNFVPIKGPKGLYLYGDVGSGKTMVMDLFYDTLPIERKKRIHFHQFMQDIHKKQHNLLTKKRISTDVIPAIANELTNEAWVLCFDEFQVVDITDAMLLRRLLEELLNRGVVIVLTSNRPPDDLYKNGIQRESFLNTIELLKNSNIVWQLDSGIDYRKIESIKLNVYFTPLNEQTNKKVDNIFDKLTDNLMVIPKEINFLGRKLIIEETAENICKLDFNDICGKPHSAADYLELTKNFNIIVLKNVPKMTLSDRDSARRFITLIDTIYDSRCKLIISAECELEDLFVDTSVTVDGMPTINQKPINPKNSQLQLDRTLIDDLHLHHPSNVSEAPSIFTGTEEIFAFRRSLSRLNEMRNIKWLGEDFKEKLLSSD